MKKFFLFAAVTISLTACNSDDNYIDDPIAAHISATIGEGTLSRAKNITWDKNDTIGISMSGRYLNMKYCTPNGDGIFTGTTMYFKNKQEPVTLTAYYPYRDTEGSVPGMNGILSASTTLDYQTSDTQSGIDFLYARVDNLTGMNPNVNLSFAHQMCKLTLKFVNGNVGTEVSKITSYSLEGLITDGTFDTATGICSALSTSSSTPLTVTVPVGTITSGEERPSLILFPQPVNKVTLKIHDNEEQDYICELNFGENGLSSGNNYLFTINVSKTALSVKPTIIDWVPQELDSEAKSDDSD